jgi:protein-S-isoprenylcysteine O-methyltransferase Ste14
LFEQLRGATLLVVRIPVSLPFLVLSFILFRSSHREIFDSERERTTVISDGVYGIVRHPMYLGAILLYVAVLILTLSVAAFGVWILVVAFYCYIARYEERILIDALGGDYRDYMAAVPMFVPRLRKPSS